MKFSIRVLYLYLFSFVSLVVVIIGAIRMTDLGMKTFIFTEADKYDVVVSPVEKGAVNPTYSPDKELARQRQRELSGALSMIVVGLPIYMYHWKTIQKEKAV